MPRKVIDRKVSVRLVQTPIFYTHCRGRSRDTGVVREIIFESVRLERWLRCPWKSSTESFQWYIDHINRMFTDEALQLLICIISQLCFA